MQVPTKSTATGIYLAALYTQTSIKSVQENVQCYEAFAFFRISTGDFIVLWSALALLDDVFDSIYRTHSVNKI